MSQSLEPIVPDPSVFPNLCKHFSVIALCDRDTSTIIDNEGRVLIFEQHNLQFVLELCRVMNENAERLEEAWKEGTSDGACDNREQKD